MPGDIFSKYYVDAEYLNLGCKRIIICYLYYYYLYCLSKGITGKLESIPAYGIPWTGFQSITDLIQRQTTIYTHIHIFKLFKVGGGPHLHVFGLWMETKHTEETHASMGRTCHLHTEKAAVRFRQARTQNILTEQWQCKPLPHYYTPNTTCPPLFKVLALPNCHGIR